MGKAAPLVEKKCIRAIKKDVVYLRALIDLLRLNKLLNKKFDRYKDKWVDRDGDAYSGKDYGERATEILTMGIERLHADPIKFYRSDPEYFEFVVKTLQNLP